MGKNEQKEKSRRRLRLIVAILASLIITAGAVGGSIALIGAIPRMSIDINAGQQSTWLRPGADEGNRPAQTVANKENGYMSAAQIYAEYVGSVVGIKTEGSTTNIFGQVTKFAASGSGFVISEDGYVVTNRHVVEDGETFTVAFSNDESYDATLVGFDSSNDVALLKIKKTGLKPVLLGDSGKITVGEEIVAIGNPLGELTFSLTKGVVSALDRVIVMQQGESLNMFQLDAAINRGNSGGPVFNSLGEVIGVVTAKYTDSGVEGLGFALPINDVLDIVSDLKQYGYVTGRPYFGITAGNAVDKDGYLVGARVESVASGSCAETAGLLPGDIITSIGDAEINSLTDLLVVRNKYRAGDRAEIGIIRDDKNIKIQLIFDEQKPES